MSNLVRVRANGYEFNVGAAHAKAHDMNVLDEPTHRRDGAPRPTTRAKGRPVKPKISVADAAEKKAAKQSADTDTAFEKEIES